MSADSNEPETDPPPGVPATLDRYGQGFALGKCGSYSVHRYGPPNARGLHVYRWSGSGAGMSGVWQGCVATLPRETAERFQVCRATASAREVLGVRL